MTDSRRSNHCPDCGTRLSTEAWGENLCLRCLLQLAAPTLHSVPAPAGEAPTEILSEALSNAPTAPPGYEPTVVSDERPISVAGSASFSFSAGQVLGDRYRVLKLLGSGGMGEVWRAYDLKLRVDVALKSLHASLAGGEEGLELLRSEVRAAREVISPNVCRLFDLVEVDGEELVSMEYIDGQTLLQLLKERGPLELQEAREIGSQFLAGLEAIHQADLVHRDVKPENIMLTRSGRVVVMDFGLTSPTGEGELSGTPAYMAPEQGRGEGTDARADVFSAGMVLAEMLSAERGPEDSSRQSFWENVRRDPPELPESPWKRVLLRAVASDREERYASAAELARVLEEITVRVEGAENEQPYPGLSSFRQEDSRFFFGREAEVETVWKKLQTSYLLGLIGSSGSGKSSFLNAGLLPAKPDGWAHLKITPGRTPFEALGRALLREIGADAQALPNLEALRSIEGALSALQVWRGRHPEALLVVDQFEELFTQNDLAVQQSFAGLLSRAALEGGVRVLLSMRDDFLIHCQRFSALAPVFSELTPLGPPVGPALRRALTQPALSLGYRFEDDRMVEEMLAEVTRERGALPLIAFTTARLWEERDPEQGLLTRTAYDAMGGVSGALAGHAERTLEAIGSDKVEIVREIFRNLVTAQGTRAVMEVEEVLSVFAGGAEGEEEDIVENKRVAGEVLASLVDARLLTSYEVQVTEGETSHRRVEIVHESLLSSWPRLVHWRRQDAEGAQLRDELRQAAKLWDSRQRQPDLLWTGTAFREFELWRERYRGRLTALEEEYVAAMVELDQRQRRRRRIAVAVVLAAALAVSAITGTLWRRSEIARQEATTEALRAEASQLVTLARLEEERYPTAALAYATRSLELYDTLAARRLALRILWKAPVARIFPLDFVPVPCGPRVGVSPDGDWIAIDYSPGEELRLYSRQGVLQKSLPHPPVLNADGTPFCWRDMVFSPDSELLLTHSWLEPEVRIWSVRRGELLRTIRPGPPDEEVEQVFRGVRVVGDRIVTLTWSHNRVSFFAQSWPVAGGEPEALGWMDSDIDSWEAPLAWDLDPTGKDLVYARPGDRVVYSLPLAELESGSQRVVGSHDEAITRVAFSPQGDRLILENWSSGRVAIWSLESPDGVPVRAPEEVAGEGRGRQLNVTGSWLGWGSSVERSGYLWDPGGPPDVGPVRLKRHDEDRFRGSRFDPQGEWFATVHNKSISFWSLDGRWSQEFDGGRQMMGWGKNLLFTPDGRQLVSCPQDGVYLWPLTTGAGEKRKIKSQCLAMAMSPTRPELLVGYGAENPMSMVLVSVDDASVRPLADVISESFGAVAFDREGRLAAAGAWVPQSLPLRFWSLESGESWTLAVPQGSESPPYTVVDLEFAADGGLYSAGEGGVRRWDVDRETSEVLLAGASARMDLSPDGRSLLVALAEEVADTVLVGTRLLLIDLESGTEREITTHGSDLQMVAFGPEGRVIVTGDATGVVRIGPVSGEEPHLLLGHEEYVKAVAVSPDGRWVFSAAGTKIRRWSMPDLSRRPLHTLPIEELLEELHSQTNLRVVEDPESPDGWRLELGPFSG